MKRATALKNLSNIIKKVRDINGIYATPLCSREFVKVKRIWVFGSVAKGCDNPNDLDIFIELADPHQPVRRGRKSIFRKVSNGLSLHGSFRINKATINRGTPYPLDSTQELCKWLGQGSKKTSIHVVGDDKIFGKLDCKYLVYPRNDFADIRP